jgi:Family of unknown function (DUF6459)
MPPQPPTSEEPPGADSGSAGGAVLPLVPGLGRRPTRRRPLPDAAAVRLLRVPDSAPPYDDSVGEAGPAGRPVPSARAPEGPARPARPRRGGTTTRPGVTPKTPAQPTTPGQSSPSAARDKPSSPATPGPPSRPATPGPSSPSAGARGAAADARWPSQFAQVLAETLAGSRPQGQIRPWTTDQARRRIRQLGPSLTAEVQPRVRRIMTSRPATGVVEMTVVVGFGPRIRALAVRLERDASARPADTGREGPYRSPGPERDAGAARWICTAIEAA